MRRAFTLIELLIVIAIIAILALIAIPNFLEAQIRSKVSRVKADLRQVGAGLEAYFVDYNTYFAWRETINGYTDYTLRNLTTPIAYTTTIPNDPFGDRLHKGNWRANTYEFGLGKAGAYSSLASAAAMLKRSDTYELESCGPDKWDDTTDEAVNQGYNLLTGQFPWLTLTSTSSASGAVLGMIYDPTNGTKSRGQIFRGGGACPGPTSAHVTWSSVVKR